MKVEIDASDVQYGAYYSDEKCKELQGVLCNDSQYAECEVKRARWENDANHDPFYILNDKGEEIIRIERWEAYALSSSELISYINIQRSRNRLSRKTETFLVILLFAIGFTLAGLISAAVSLYLEELESISATMNLVVLCSIASFLAGIVYYSMRRIATSQMKRTDLEAVRMDSSFLEMLRKLAERPEVHERTRKELMSRIKHIEDTTAGIIS